MVGLILEGLEEDDAGSPGRSNASLLPARLPRNLPYYFSVDVTTLSWCHEVYSFENGHYIALMCRYELLSILIVFFQGQFWQPKKPGNDE